MKLEVNKPMIAYNRSLKDRMPATVGAFHTHPAVEQQTSSLRTAGAIPAIQSLCD